MPCVCVLTGGCNVLILIKTQLELCVLLEEKQGGPREIAASLQPTDSALRDSAS